MEKILPSTSAYWIIDICAGFFFELSKVSIGNDSSTV
jgi:hypothetical protein